jgi:hypothetical protein
MFFNVLSHLQRLPVNASPKKSSSIAKESFAGFAVPDEKVAPLADVKL